MPPCSQAPAQTPRTLRSCRTKGQSLCPAGHPPRSTNVDKESVSKNQNRRTHRANVVCKVVNRENKFEAVSNLVWDCLKATI